MPSLDEIQARVRDAVVTGAAIDPAWFEGGRFPQKRLAVHRRNYESSLITALQQKFPATAWLVGTEYLEAAAREFIRRRPPQAPCIAEYGWDFPAFIASLPGSLGVPYLNDFSQLEWCVGHAAIAVDGPFLEIGDFRGFEPAALTGARLDLQPGVFYFHASWPVDRLLGVYLSETAPERFEFDPEKVFLQIRGARGDFRIDRLAAADFVFRRALSEAQPVGEAAVAARETDPAFKLSAAIAALVEDGLVTRIAQSPAPTGDES